MGAELLASQKNESGLRFDPRTKLAVLVTLAVLILGGSFQTAFFYLPALIPFVMLLASKMWKGAGVYFGVFGVCLFLQEFVLPHISGVPGYLLMLIAVMPLYFSPSFAAAYYAVITTTVSELIAAMERLHIPKQVTIPMAVMFRFFPTMMEEWSAIGDAMKMRGIRLRGGRAASILEYRLVPMLMCCVKIGEELSAASLTRGLGGPVKRTNICDIGFHVQDMILLLLCLVMNRLAESGKTIVVITHDPEFIVRCCDQALHIENGHVVEEYSLGSSAGIEHLLQFFLDNTEEVQML